MSNHRSTPTPPRSPKPKEKSSKRSRQDRRAAIKNARRDAQNSPTNKALETSANPPQSTPKRNWGRYFGWTKSWILWWSIAIALTTGIGAFSIALLLKLPALPNCPAIFWPTASASLRMYCAEIAANKRTVEDLLEAIALVNDLPPDHPLRDEIDRLTENWSIAILDLAGEEFDAGFLEEAIAIANQIPPHTTAHRSVAEKIRDWEIIWAEGESIYQEAEDALRQERFRDAFQISSRLLRVENAHWRTEKHQELNDLITSARRDGNILAQARDLAAENYLDSFLSAIELVQGIPQNSYVYGEAQNLLNQFGESMIDLAEAALNREDYEAAIAIINAIPEELNLEDQSQDFLTLALAQQHAWGGTVIDLENAILQARQVDQSRPLYGRSQQLISQWQLEIQDVMRLDTARRLAQGGSTHDLRAAIAEASQVPDNNPRASEAQNQISDWVARIQTVEDQPYLERAERLAAGHSIGDLQSAIAEASQIEQGRALYNEAQAKIGEWQSEIQQVQDQPYLDQARLLADQGDLPGAIAIAEQIQSGRSLYGEAQADIDIWQTQIEGQTRMREAYNTASLGTSAALISAIQTADQIPMANPSREEADRMINSWSWDVLDIARMQAAANVLTAIATAQSIPPQTEAYAAAQLEIQTWEDFVESTAPPPAPVPPLPTEAIEPPSSEPEFLDESVDESAEEAEIFDEAEILN